MVCGPAQVVEQLAGQVRCVATLEIVLTGQRGTMGQRVGLGRLLAFRSLRQVLQVAHLWWQEPPARRSRPAVGLLGCPRCPTGSSTGSVQCFVLADHVGQRLERSRR